MRLKKGSYPFLFCVKSYRGITKRRFPDVVKFICFNLKITLLRFKIMRQVSKKTVPGDFSLCNNRKKFATERPIGGKTKYKTSFKRMLKILSSE